MAAEDESMTITVEPFRFRYCVPIPRMLSSVNLTKCTSLSPTSIASPVKRAALKARAVIDMV